MLFKKIVKLSFVILIALLPLMAWAQTDSLAENEYVFIDSFTYVSGTSNDPMIAIDFPMYTFSSSTGVLQYFTSLDLQPSTQVIIGSGLGLGGDVGMGASTGLTVYDNLVKLNQYQVNLDGSALYYYKDQWINLPPGATFRDTYETTEYWGFTGQLLVEFRVTNHGIQDKSKIQAPNLNTPVPTSTTEITSTPTPTPYEFICGDVNRDRLVNIVDALMIAQHYVGFRPYGFDPAMGDVNADGSVTVVDALIVAQYYIGLIDNLSC